MPARAVLSPGVLSPTLPVPTSIPRPECVGKPTAAEGSEPWVQTPEVIEQDAGGLAGSPGGLSQSAARYGLGLDYQVDGVPTVTGSVPPTVDLAERTEDGFGRGQVLASPFGMALVAATVAAGKTPVPRLIEGRPTAVAGDTTPISAKMLDALRPMMRLVVTNGTATDVCGCGAVFGKTGEAEFLGGSHSWFAGYRGDLAFAALIVGGGSSA